jgi:hypothetical protein
MLQNHVAFWGSVARISSCLRQVGALREPLNNYSGTSTFAPVTPALAAPRRSGCGRARVHVSHTPLTSTNQREFPSVGRATFKSARARWSAIEHERSRGTLTTEAVIERHALAGKTPRCFGGDFSRGVKRKLGSPIGNDRAADFSPHGDFE